MAPSIHIVPEPPASEVAPGGEEPTDHAAASERTETAAQTTTRERGRDPLARFRRRIEQFRGDADAFGGDDARDEQSELNLELMLLREENARLKAERHRPSDVDTLIDQMRRLGDEKGDAEMVDEAWTLLTECLVIREGLERACVEIQATMGAVRDRLDRLALELDDVASEGSSAAPERSRRVRARG